jgi:multicomponent K+:H+ antiporter subunit A
VLSLIAGGGMAWLAFAMMSRPFYESTSTFFLENALGGGGGTNVVNVMLVDFRGFDTFGEIVVLGIVAIVIYALLRRFRPAREAMDIPEQQRYVPGDLQTDLLNPRNASDTAVGYLMVPAVLVRLLLPFATLVAAYIFVRGHNQPGGGLWPGWCSRSPC